MSATATERRSGVERLADALRAAFPGARVYAECARVVVIPAGNEPYRDRGYWGVRGVWIAPTDCGGTFRRGSGWRGALTGWVASAGVVESDPGGRPYGGFDTPRDPAYTRTVPPRPAADGDAPGQFPANLDADAVAAVVNAARAVYPFARDPEPNEHD